MHKSNNQIFLFFCVTDLLHVAERNCEYCDYLGPEVRKNIQINGRVAYFDDRVGFNSASFSLKVKPTSTFEINMYIKTAITN